MIDNDDGKITQIGVQFKSRPEDGERSLLRLHEVPKAGGCNHLFVTYIVDEALATVECGQCGEKLSPTWVLQKLANNESHHARIRDDYQAEMKRLKERSRTKCDHCGKMTRISKR